MSLKNDLSFAFDVFFGLAVCFLLAGMLSKEDETPGCAMGIETNDSYMTISPSSDQRIFINFTKRLNTAWVSWKSIRNVPELSIFKQPQNAFLGSHCHLRPVPN
ncbi:hypothetical protein AX774_g5617 [Zancudomyces culisetae]|uniref:Uncharacterized protein n=1 Tax=Zancudomyces culisetae TaxID=1213189 RepID=A0A1R1PJA4_ZANCU|nr:hypothetical protein AX774_g5617 [Zancudomyces culisetae]|eukprot:OMH80942.1 hypothetical protein AX774_g5617 [Zancudomyces culisetae]